MPVEKNDTRIRIVSTRKTFDVRLVNFETGLINLRADCVPAISNQEGIMNEQKRAGIETPREGRVSKKEQILSLYLSGINEIEDLSMITGARASYVGSVLREAGLAANYFDLYTSTAQPMNVYSKFFANKLGFKDEETARQSLELIDRLHRQFEMAGDRAGQHHALSMALVLFDRARWTGKDSEA